LRKIIAILLINLLIYNIVGHYFLLIYQQKMAGVYFSQSLNQYPLHENNFFVLKIPVSLYLPAKNTDFEPISGSFEANGRFYEMIKRKVESDTLYVYCANNLRKTQLADQLANYVKTYVIDYQDDQNTPSQSFLLKSFVKEYLIASIFHFSFLSSVYFSSSCNFPFNESNCPKLSLSVASPPPETT
jgi:hypothetical protein